MKPSIFLSYFQINSPTDFTNAASPVIRPKIIFRKFVPALTFSFKSVSYPGVFFPKNRIISLIAFYCVTLSAYAATSPSARIVFRKFVPKFTELFSFILGSGHQSTIDIFRLANNFQMVGVYAGRISAQVVQNFIRGDFRSFQFVRKTMGKSYLTHNAFYMFSKGMQVL